MFVFVQKVDEEFLQKSKHPSQSIEVSKGICRVGVSLTFDTSILRYFDSSKIMTQTPPKKGYIPYKEGSIMISAQVTLF